MIGYAFIRSQIPLDGCTKSDEEPIRAKTTLFAKLGIPEHPQKRLETTDSRGRMCSETHSSFHVHLVSRYHPFK